MVNLVIVFITTDCFLDPTSYIIMQHWFHIANNHFMVASLMIQNLNQSKFQMQLILHCWPFHGGTLNGKHGISLLVISYGSFIHNRTFQGSPSQFKSCQLYITTDCFVDPLHGLGALFQHATMVISWGPFVVQAIALKIDPSRPPLCLRRYSFCITTGHFISHHYNSPFLDPNTLWKTITLIW